MKPLKSWIPSGCFLGFLLVVIMIPRAASQAAADVPSGVISPIASLELTPGKASLLTKAVDAHDYTTAEKLLLNEIEYDSHSPRAAHLLAFAGRVYFLNRDYLNAAVAWKKSNTIVTLEPPLQFSLAMAYIRLGHPDWARKILESLGTDRPNEPLYPYWLGRLDYDAQNYLGAIAHFREAIVLDPGMSRAYDNLGLCHFHLNENMGAIEDYQKAIDLDRKSFQPSPWPYLNLAITLQFLNRLNEAEANLREAIRLDTQLAAAHFQLGGVLEDLGRVKQAVFEFRESARLDPRYAEPHFALARILHKLGQESAAQEEVQTYRRLHSNESKLAVPQAR